MFFNSIKIAHRAVIKFLVEKGLKAIEFHTKMVKELGESNTSKKCASDWTSGDPAGERPKSASIPERIGQVHCF